MINKWVSGQTAGLLTSILRRATGRWACASTLIISLMIQRRLNRLAARTRNMRHGFHVVVAPLPTWRSRPYSLVRRPPKVGWKFTHLSPVLCQKICCNNKIEKTVDGGPCYKLCKELEGCFWYHASNPKSHQSPWFSSLGRNKDRQSHQKAISCKECISCWSKNLPRAEMIHLAHTTFDFPAVMGTVWLPIQACGTPYRPAISLANKSVFAIEVSQARSWFSRSRRKGISAAYFTLSLRVPLWPSWDISRIIRDGVQKAKVGEGNE